MNEDFQPSTIPEVESPDMGGTAEVDTAAAGCARPEHVPEKFWDEANASVKTDVLLQSYAELEQRLSRTLPQPSEEEPENLDKVLSALGRPESADEYKIDPDELGVEADAELNSVLHAAGFTQDQAALVYKLAAERLQPMMSSMQDEIQMVEQKLRLEQHFGGADRYRQVAEDLRGWAEAKFGAAALDGMASTFDGVLALHRMMQAEEPELAGNNGSSPGTLSKVQLDEMVSDPRYWRDQDPEFIARVSEGFAQLYPG